MLKFLMINANFQTVTIEDLYEITRMSTECISKEVFIYEKESLDKVIGDEKSEELREQFLQNNVKIKQITNLPDISKYSVNTAFTNKCMSFRYIPKNVYDITREILIFDDIVAIYTFNEEYKLLIIQDKKFADSQKQLFLNLWEEGISPKLDFEYSPNHSFYNSIDFTVDGKQIIIYPDAEAKFAYKEMSYESIQDYLGHIYKDNYEFYKNSTYLIGFMWSYEGDKMLDLWKFDSNYVDDRSGPLSECKIFRNSIEVRNLGLSSGNTLLVLGYEEKLRRIKGNLDDYLKGEPPKLPLEILNGMDYFQN